MSRTALVDADILKYKAGFSSQRTTYQHKSGPQIFSNKTEANEYLKVQAGFDPSKHKIRAWTKEHWIDDDWTIRIVLGTFDSCKEFIDDTIDEIKRQTDSEEVLLCLTQGRTFRDDLAVTVGYKANREGSAKPEYGSDIVEYFKDAYPWVEAVGYEADDLMGMNQTTDTVICSNDKDMRMIPGRHYNFTTNEKFMVTPFEADRWFFIQLLAGDATDNIPGVPGIGMKRAATMVDQYDGDTAELVEAIKEEYCYTYGVMWIETMHEMAGLVWILRKGETPETAGWRKLLDVEK